MTASSVTAGSRGARLLHERDRLSKALLSATADLAQGQDAETILRRTCEALAAASPHIRLAWMYLGDAGAEFIRPAYAAGQARRFAAEFTLGQEPAEQRGPTRRALTLGRPVSSRIRSDPTAVPYRHLAEEYGLESSVSLPFGNPPAGVVTVYADEPDYFMRLGVEPFRAFAHLGQVALEQANLRKRLEEIATFDHLTGLMNRRAMVEVLEREHARAERSGRPYSLILFDLDHFKLINDSYGHTVGDHVLTAVARHSESALRDGDWLARWGGEEFLCLLPETDHAEAMVIGERLRQAVSANPVVEGGWHIDVSLTGGVASYPNDGQDINRLVSAADANLYEAKRAGRNRVLGGQASPEGDAVIPVATQLRRALQEERLFAAFQPIVDLRSGDVAAEEALARIVQQDGQIIYGGRFIEAATQMQFVHRVDFEILRQSITRCATQLQRGACRKHFVNISADLLRHPELVEEIMHLAESACAGCADKPGTVKPIVLEVNEHQFIGDAVRALNVLRPLLDFGMQLAIDGFGGGYSSFSYFVDLPVGYLKLEGALVARLRAEPRVRTILEGVQDTARRLGVVTIAERVEDAETVAILREMGTDWAQGHYFARAELA
ncbi:MAG TPA: GGDEF domain-containing protein [Gammaproteobacteria bacterium]|nr:GGDEF domain-containing protein [Gammaproteobacteria bacterium]